MSQKSTLSLHLLFRKDTPKYVLDFFEEGTKNNLLPTTLYDFGFKFDNKPNFSDDATLFFEEKNGRFYLQIFYKFDFNDDSARGYWPVGGLAQYAENSKMAGYVTHADGNTQIFGFEEKLCFWKSDLRINFNLAKYKKPELKIRGINSDEIKFLEEMLFQAIFTPEGQSIPEKNIIFEPFLHHYINDFGRKNDVCLVAEHENKLIGAIWTRIFSENERGYGFLDAETPELSMAVAADYRNSGIGAILLDALLEKLKASGCQQVSLSVDARNFARKFYHKHGFRDFKIESNSVLMVCKF
jgi:ribosomal protein S18 acetylase RimI-like enzyme